jgi:hypothetical protein
MNNNKLQKDIENFKNAYEQVSLSVDEKQNLKSQLFAKITPVENKTSVKSPFFAFTFYLKMAPVALVLFALIGAPVSYAAERSLPGQPLYKFKTKINEEVKAVFVPEEEKNDYYQSLLKKRAKEIKTLSKKGEIKEEELVEFEEVLEVNVMDTISSIERSKDSEDDILQDYQTVVAVLSINEESLNFKSEEDVEVEVGKPEVFTMSAQAPDEIESDIKVRAKFQSLKKIAVDALTERVENASKNNETDSAILVDELIEDARDKVQKVILDSGHTEETGTIEEGVVDGVEAESEESENESLLLEIETISSSFVMHTAVVSTTTTKLNQVLDLHERLIMRALEQEIEEVTPDVSL